MNLGIRVSRGFLVAASIVPAFLVGCASIVPHPDVLEGKVQSVERRFASDGSQVCTAIVIAGTMKAQVSSSNPDECLRIQAAGKRVCLRRDAAPMRIHIVSCPAPTCHDCFRT